MNVTQALEIFFHYNDNIFIIVHRLVIVTTTPLHRMHAQVIHQSNRFTSCPHYRTPAGKAAKSAKKVPDAAGD